MCLKNGRSVPHSQIKLAATLPSVMMSAKMTAREIAKDYQISSAVMNGVPNKTQLEAADD